MLSGGRLTACATTENNPLRIRAASHDFGLVAAPDQADVAKVIAVNDTRIGKRPK